MSNSKMPIALKLCLYFVLLFIDHLWFFRLVVLGGLVGSGVVSLIAALSGGSALTAFLVAGAIWLAFYGVLSFGRTCIIFSQTFWMCLPPRTDNGPTDEQKQ